MIEDNHKIIIIVVLMGLLAASFRLFIGGIGLFAIGVFLFSLIPYFSYAIISYWLDIKWVNIIAGIAIVLLDVYINLDIFLFHSDTELSKILVFNPELLVAICMVIFVVLFFCHVLYKVLKDKKLDWSSFVDRLSTKKIFLFFVIPVTLVLVTVNVAYFLISLGQ